jgi:hypothetical protein
VARHRAALAEALRGGHRSAELYAAIGGRFEGRMNDDLSDGVVNVEHLLAGFLRELLILIVPSLLVCVSSYKVQLVRKIDAASDDGARLVIKIEELNDSVVNLLLDPGEVMLKSANKQACHF